MFSKEEIACLKSGDYFCEVDFQSGWVNLTLKEESKSVAREVAEREVEKFNQLELLVSRQNLVRQMSKKALDAKVDDVVLYASYYADSGGDLIDFDIDIYGEDGETPSPSDVAPILLEFGNMELGGEPDVTYMDLPVGPAVRVQAPFLAKKVFGFGRQIVEVVRYAVCPRVNTDVVVMKAGWTKLEFSEDLTGIVDDLAQTLRLVPNCGGSSVEVVQRESGS